MIDETGENLTIGEICAGSESYIGRVVTLKGIFQGWQKIQCQFPDEAADTPLTRSDWLIRTGADCIYVTGDIPENLNPIKVENLGILVELEAEVMLSQSKKIYLVYRKSRRV